tara:strand:- start:414 stop:746 length:333 start_codon:yes stop_codon:yes gene_type:complete
MNIQCKSGLLELCLLSILSRTESTGYNLQRLLEKRVKIADGTIYPTLRRMVDDAVIQVDFKEVEDEKRKIYQITEAGEIQLQSQTKEWNRLILGVSKILGGEDICLETNS